MNTTALAKLALVAAMLAGKLICLFFGSLWAGSPLPLDRNRGGPAVPASVEGAHAAANPNSARPPSPGVSEVRFRFGFLEFENDPHAPAE